MKPVQNYFAQVSYFEHFVPLYTFNYFCLFDRSLVKVNVKEELKKEISKNQQVNVFMHG